MEIRPNVSINSQTGHTRTEIAWMPVLEVTFLAEMGVAVMAPARVRIGGCREELEVHFGW